MNGMIIYQLSMMHVFGNRIFFRRLAETVAEAKTVHELNVDMTTNQQTMSQPPPEIWRIRVRGRPLVVGSCK